MRVCRLPKTATARGGTLTYIDCGGRPARLTSPLALSAPIVRARMRPSRCLRRITTILSMVLMSSSTSVVVAGERRAFSGEVRGGQSC